MGLAWVDAADHGRYVDPVESAQGRSEPPECHRRASHEHPAEVWLGVFRKEDVPTTM